MHTLRIMDKSGDTVTTWNPVVEAERIIAEKAFEEAAAMGHAAFKLDSSGNGEQIKRFDPDAETIVMMPQMVGG